MNISGLAKNYSNSILVDALYGVEKPKPVSSIVSDMLVSKEPIKDNYSEKIVDPKDSANITNFAARLSVIDKNLKAAGNTQGTEGLRKIAQQFVNRPEEFEDLMKSVDKLDYDGYQNFFSTIDKLMDKGLKIDKFTDAMSYLSDGKVEKSFIESANKILTDDSDNKTSRQNVLDKLSKTVINTQNDNLKASEKSDKLYGLFDLVVKSNDLAEINTVIDKFNE